MSSSVQISITFLEGMNAQLRQVAQAGTAANAKPWRRLSPTVTTAAWLLPLVNSVMAVSLLAMATGVLCTWR